VHNAFSSGVNPNIFFGGAIEAPRGGEWGKEKFFLIMDLKMAICGAFLVQFFAV